MILLDLPPYIGRRLHSLDASPTVFLLTPAELPCELDEKATITTDATTVERDDLFTIPTASGIKPRSIVEMIITSCITMFSGRYETKRNCKPIRKIAKC